MNPITALFTLLLFSMPGAEAGILAVGPDDALLASEPAPPGSSEAGPATDDVARAEQLLERGEADAALVELRRLVANHPDDPEILRLLGSALYESGRAAEALPHLERAAELDPEGADLLLLLGSVQQELDDAAGARSSYERYLELEPSGAFAGEVRYILGQL